MPTIRVFNYIEELDAFLVTDAFTKIADFLGLTEWHPVVWVGRLFKMDNDFGEHWFDNWDKRKALKAQAKERGIYEDDLMVLDPEKFADGRDGPCHTPEFRKRFWTDVLKSLELSHEILFEEARLFNKWRKENIATDWDNEYIPDLEERISQIKAGRLPTQDEKADA